MFKGKLIKISKGAEIIVSCMGVKMKKLAVMGSGTGGNFEAIAKYFKDKDVEITCISDAEDSLILNKAEKFAIINKFLPFEENLKYFSNNKFDLVVLAGYMKILPDEVLKLSKFVNIHPSLLPAFKGKDAIKRAFKAGVKVSGITIHWVETRVDEGKIIAQYPVFIDNLMRLDEFEEEIHCIEHKLYPIVIEKLLEDKVFDFQDLIKSGCSRGKCDDGGCKGGKCGHDCG